MKMRITFFLLLFLLFLSFPTIVGFLNSDADISMVYSMSEEEEFQKTVTFKEAVKTKKDVSFIYYKLKSVKNIFSENHIGYDNVLEEIFSPPPNVYY